GEISGRQTVTYTNVQTTRVDGSAAVNAAVGPNTAARSTAFTGLSAKERAVQALYLDALGRAGSKAELDSWVKLFLSGATSLSAAVVRAIEGSRTAEDHLVKSWYIAYLGRQANGTEEQPFVNLLHAGQSEEQVLSLLLGAQGFYNRAQTLVSSG